MAELQLRSVAPLPNQVLDSSPRPARLSLQSIPRRLHRTQLSFKDTPPSSRFNQEADESPEGLSQTASALQRIRRRSIAATLEAAARTVEAPPMARDKPSLHAWKLCVRSVKNRERIQTEVKEFTFTKPSQPLRVRPWRQTRRNARSTRRRRASVVKNKEQTHYLSSSLIIQSYRYTLQNGKRKYCQEFRCDKRELRWPEPKPRTPFVYWITQGSPNFDCFRQKPLKCCNLH